MAGETKDTRTVGRGPVEAELAGADPAEAELAGADPAETDPAEAETKPVEAEPDARFTFANERTFLAWNRTALALMAAGLAIGQLLPPFPGVPWGRQALAIPLIVLGAVLSVAGYVEWRRNQRALRLGAPLPRSPLPRLLAVTVAGMSITATIVLVLSELLR